MNKLKKAILTFVLTFLVLQIHAQMVLEYDIDTPNTTIALPLNGTVNVNVDWGDGSSQNVTSTGSLLHTFSTIGTKTVTITGLLTQFGPFADFFGQYRLTKIKSWNNLGLTSLSSAFYNATFLSSVPNTLPSTIINLEATFTGTSIFNQDISNWNTANVKYMSNMFERSNFNQDISNWNTVNVTTMSYMFANSNFNQDISNWNTSNVKDMSNMFFNATEFNQPIGNWSTENVTDMSNMFNGASTFNQPIGNWNTSNVTSMEGMFSGAENFNQPIGNWNTSNVIDMSKMFSSTSFNQSLDNWNTNNVTNMSSMFLDATAFNQPIGNWNTENVTNMNSMFSGATDFNQTLNNWNTSSVTDMKYMFYNASTFNQPIGNWNTFNVTNMFYMFKFSSAFNQPIGNWNTENVTDMNSMFDHASAFNQSIENWNTSKVTNMNGMFNNALSFNQPIGNWNTSNVTDMGYMFSSSNFNQPIDNWNTENVTNMNGMFSLTNFNQPLENWNTENVTDMSVMFMDNPVFNQPIGNWNTKNVIYMNSMFQFASAFNQPIGNWNTNNVKNMNLMLASAIAFNQPIGDWNTSNVTNMFGMFNDSKAFNQPIGNWNTENVTSMKFMFANAFAFNQPIGNWNTSNVTDMSYMFSYAKAFNQPIGNWNTTKVTDMYWMFREATVFNQPISSWNTENVTEMSFMFRDATAFNQNLGKWNINSLTNANFMFSGANLCFSNYDSLLIGWSSQVVNNGVYFGGGDNKYSSLSEAARNKLISNSWNITDAGLITFNSIPTIVNTCNSFTWSKNNTTYTKSGIYLNVNCASVDTLKLTINKTSYSTFNQSACNSYLWGVKNITQSGIYKDTLTNATGCDSIITLNLTINKPTFKNILESAILSYTFNNQLLTKSGIYKDTLTNKLGCDSIVTLNLTINKISQTILGLFDIYKTITDANFSLTGYSDKNLPISYISSDTNIASIINNKVTIKKAGLVNITASQSGNDTYATASPIIFTLIIEKASQKILSLLDLNKSVSDKEFSLIGYTDSNLPISYTSSDTNIASIINNKVTIKKAGIITITANQIGNDSYNPISQNVTLTISKSNQSVLDLSSKITKSSTDSAFYLPLITNAGLPLTYISSDTNIANIVNNKVTIKKAGSITITANQIGNDSYNPVSQNVTLIISKSNQNVLDLSSIITKSSTDSAFYLPLITNAGLPLTYTSSDTNIASIVNNKVTIKKAGSITITANQIGNENYNPLSQNIKLNISKSNQSVIDLSSIITKSTSDSAFYLPLLTNAGLPLTYVSSDTNIASIVNNKVTIKKAGSIIITANQSGNDSYNPLSNSVNLFILDTTTNRELFAFINSNSEIEISGKVNEMTVYSIDGKIIYTGEQKKVHVDVCGMYVVLSKTKMRYDYFKVIKN